MAKVLISAVCALAPSWVAASFFEEIDFPQHMHQQQYPQALVEAFGPFEAEFDKVKDLIAAVPEIEEVLLDRANHPGFLVERLEGAALPQLAAYFRSTRQDARLVTCMARNPKLFDQQFCQVYGPAAPRTLARLLFEMGALKAGLSLDQSALFRPILLQQPHFVMNVPVEKLRPIVPKTDVLEADDVARFCASLREAHEDWKLWKLIRQAFFFLLIAMFATYCGF
ncbi:MAG: hypothetical protein C0514_03075 [Candidatus Puniceispirillum sp.]|nr:hypothetical protein [Candidatus Puniceispirillum sp.]